MLRDDRMSQGYLTSDSSTERYAVSRAAKPKNQSTTSSIVTSTPKSKATTCTLSRTSSQPTTKSSVPAKKPIKKTIVYYRCDGECRKKYPVSELTVFGLCEHAVCETCLMKCPRVGTTMGTDGCPNPRCYLLDMAVICPDKRKRMKQIREAFKLKSPIATDSSTRCGVSEYSDSQYSSSVSFFLGTR